MAGDRIPSGNANRIGVALAVITILISAVSSIPSFLSLRGKDPAILYEFTNSRLLYPEGLDRARIRRLLVDNNLPKAVSTLRISNRGDMLAREVAVTATVSGRIVAWETNPTISSRPVWVDPIVEFDSTSPGRLRVNLSNFGLARTFTITVSYQTVGGDGADWEVFYDGRPAELVQALASLPDNIRAVSFAPALRVLAIGSLFTFIAYLLLRFREGALISSIVKIGHLVTAITPWRRFKSNLVYEICKLPGVFPISVTEGNIEATDPFDFWDGIVQFGARRVAIEVHTDKQHWPGIVGESEDQREYAVRLLAMARRTTPELQFVAVVNDADCWSGDKGREFQSLFQELARGSVAPRFLFVSGSPASVANQINRAVTGDQ